VRYGYRWLGLTLTTMIASVLANPVQAQGVLPEVAAFYIGGEGGWTQLNTSTITGSNGHVDHETFKTGFNAGARAGYQWGPWRLEGEFAYRRNDVRGEHDVSAHPLSGPPHSITGDRHAYAEMANLIYDVALAWPVTPHIGGGIGAAQVGRNVNPGGGLLGEHSSDTVFAYQGIAGLRYLITPSVAFDLDYRYFATQGPTFRTATGVTQKADYQTHNLVASLTLLFGPPPPAAVPVAPPAPPPTRNLFIVFFDWDRDTITSEGRAIVQQAADAFKAGASVQIQVTGYTDASGSVGYNQRLSERRATNVANALAGMGVPRSQMMVSGRGKADQRVPTADGVREPQNRRVEIVLP
jgi:OmpA-OmpF porin, OOP family